VRGALLKEIYNDRIVLIQDDEEIELWLNDEKLEEGDLMI